jgi:hypothetical protein
MYQEHQLSVLPEREREREREGGRHLSSFLLRAYDRVDNCFGMSFPTMLNRPDNATLNSLNLRERERENNTTAVSNTELQASRQIPGWMWIHAVLFGFVTYPTAVSCPDGLSTASIDVETHL